MFNKDNKIGILKEILWKNNSMTSYNLLSAYIENGGKYKDENYTFEKLLSSLKSQPDIEYDEETDKFTIYRQFNVNIHLKDTRKRLNCYDCQFRLEKGTNSVKIRCALDPFIRPNNVMDFGKFTSCPLNGLINTLKQEEIKIG